MIVSRFWVHKSDGSGDISHSVYYLFAHKLECCIPKVPEVYHEELDLSLLFVQFDS